MGEFVANLDVGLAVGLSVGDLVGLFVGLPVGDSVGVVLGLDVGLAVVGLALGHSDEQNGASFSRIGSL